MTPTASNDDFGRFDTSQGPSLSNERRALCLGALCFDRGEFHAAHEHWESAWRLARVDERTRALWLQSLVLTAGAWYHLANGRERGFEALLARARERLDAALASTSKDVSGWRAAAQRWRDALASAAIDRKSPPNAGATLGCDAP